MVRRSGASPRARPCGRRRARAGARLRALFGPLLAAALAAGCARLPLEPLPSSASACRVPAYAAAAGFNRAAAQNLAVAPFGRPERGWAVYASAVRVFLQSPCDADTEAFAQRLAAYQGRWGLSPTGALDGPTLLVLKTAWQDRRPFLAARRAGGPCPAGAAAAALRPLRPEETLGGKSVLLRADALLALRRLRAAARAALGDGDGRLLVFSGYRSPEADALRCRTEANCQGPARALCSAHRTGLAVDLDVGAAPGFAPDASADANRLSQSRGRPYLWLLQKAGRYGFVNYAFEPWHWEYARGAPALEAGGQGPP